LVMGPKKSRLLIGGRLLPKSIRRQKVTLARHRGKRPRGVKRFVVKRRTASNTKIV